MQPLHVITGVQIDPGTAFNFRLQNKVQARTAGRIGADSGNKKFCQEDTGFVQWKVAAKCLRCPGCCSSNLASVATKVGAEHPSSPGA